MKRGIFLGCASIFALQSCCRGDIWRELWIDDGRYTLEESTFEDFVKVELLVEDEDLELELTDQSGNDFVLRFALVHSDSQDDPPN